MARRMFAVVDVVELLRHWQAGDSISQMARALGLDRKTVRKYAGRAEAAGMAPGGAPLSQAEWATKVDAWFPELSDPRARSSVYGQIAPFHEYIEKHLPETTLATIHQRLRDEHGLTVSVASLRRYVRSELADLGAEERATVLREDPPPGQEAQLDYGHLGSWLDPASGARRRVWGFVMVLAFSRHLFCYPVLRMTQREFLAAHVAAFAFFDGCPHRLVCDNLGSGVLKPDLYDPRLNRGYAELSHHYGCLVDPARVAHPKDKPRVERMVPYVRDSFFSGREFTDLAAMRSQAASWSSAVAGQRSARPLAGAKPETVFRALEQKHLLALPRRPFEAATWQTARVSPDCHICVGGALYSVPFRLIGARLDVRLTDGMLFAYAGHELVKSHVRVAKGRRATDWQDYPSAKAAFSMRTPSWCRHRAAEIGPAASALVGELLGEQALHRLRSAQGVIHLADSYGVERLEAACALALEVGDGSYRTVRGILKAGREQLNPQEETPAPLAAAHLHGPDSLFAHLEA
jgi:transposase